MPIQKTEFIALTESTKNSMRFDLSYFIVNVGSVNSIGNKSNSSLLTGIISCGLGLVTCHTHLLVELLAMVRHAYAPSAR